MAKASRAESPVTKGMYETTPNTPTAIGAAPAPGKTPAPFAPHFEDFGTLTDFPDIITPSPEEGVGSWVVILTDYMTGVGQHDAFEKGHVRRISRVVPGYDNSEISRKVIMSRIKRLLDLRAIRLATKDEIGRDRVEVNFDTESESTVTERNRRIQLEQENEVLRQRLGIAQDAAVSMTPDKAGISGAAQSGVESENEDSTEGTDPFINE